MSAIIGLGLNYKDLLDGLKKATDKLMGFTSEGKKMGETLQKSTGLQVAEARLKDISAAAEKARQKAAEMTAKFETASKAFKPGSTEFERAYLDMNKANTAADLLGARVNQASENVSKFKNQSNQARESAGWMGESFAKVGGIIAGVFAADKIIQFGKAVIESTDATGDKYEATMMGMTEANRYLMRSIATMDFSNFINGITKAAQAGQEYANKLDEIQDRQRSLGIQKEDIEIQIAQQRLIAKNRKLDLADRQAAVDKIVWLQTKQFTKSKLLADDNLDAELTHAESISGLRKTTIIELVKNYDTYAGIISKYGEIGKQLEENAKEIDQSYSGDQIITTRTLNQDKYNESLKRLSATEQQYIKWARGYNLIVSDGAGGREKIAAALKGQLSAERELMDHKEGLLKLQNKLYTELIKEENETEKVTEKKEKASGILGKLNEELKKQNDLLEKSTDPKVIEQAQNRVAWLDLEIKALKEKGKTLDELNKPVKMQGAKGSKLPEIQMRTRDDGLIQGTEDTTKKLTEIWFGYALETAKIAEIVTGAFGNAFEIVGSKIVDGLNLASEGLQGFLKTMADTVMKLISMAMSQALSNAIVNGSMSATFTGPAAIWTQPAFIAQAVGGVLAAFAAIPKFAAGGIATRPTLGIFGEAGPEALIPLNKMGSFGGSNNVQVAVIGQIQGRDLRIANKYAERNYTLKTGRR